MVRYMTELGSQPVETFSLKFADEGFDETHHARAVADAFGCRHHLLEAPSIDGEAFAAAIRELTSRWPTRPRHDPRAVLADAAARHRSCQRRWRRRAVRWLPALPPDRGPFPGEFRQAPAHALINAGLLPASLTRRTLSGQEMLHYRRVELGPWRGRKHLAHYLSPEIAAAATRNARSACGAT